MLEKYMLLTPGFCNVLDHGAVVGFQLKIRIPYYRGAWLAVISRIEITVDSEAFGHDALCIRYKGATYSMDELARAENMHWDYGDALTLVVRKPGGLQPGRHELQLVLTLKPAFTTIVGRARRSITLVA